MEEKGDVELAVLPENRRRQIGLAGIIRVRPMRAASRLYRLELCSCILGLPDATITAGTSPKDREK